MIPKFSWLVIVAITMSINSNAKGIPTYTVVQVAAPPPYTSIEPHGVNDKGHFHGGASNDKDFTYLFWSPESGAVALSSPLGSINDIVGINNADQLAINTTAGPYVWSPQAGWSALAVWPDAATTELTAINDRGEMVGVAFDGDGGTNDMTRRAIAWGSDGSIRELKPGLVAVPAAINDHQDVVSTVYGFKDSQVQSKAILATHVGDYQDLGDLGDSGKGHFVVAVALSENGFVAVEAPEENVIGDVACFWNEAKGVRSLGLGASSARGMSRRGTMVGTVAASAKNAFYSFAWNLRWGAINIADHLAPGSPQFDLLTATGISGNGMISAGGYQAGIEAAVILTPTEQ